jgi:glyoxylase-like metal-dependent hydrolase (beta-lactamase superfamily II)
MPLSRRQTLFAGAALPLAAAAPLAALRPTLAAAQADTGTALPIQRDFSLGDWTVTTLLAGSFPGNGNPQETFGMNVSAEEFAAVAAANFLPADRTQAYFTPTLIRTGSEVILFDTGLDPAGISAALVASGLTADDVTHVVLTHMHPDHIGGLSDEAGSPTFANAAYVAGRAEFDFWAAAGNEGFEGKVRPLADRMTFLEPGGSPRPGITAVAAFGHTPGHMAFMLDNAGQQMLILGDTANHHVFSLAYPDWEVRFDANKAAAAATRRTLLGMAAADRFAIIGYHLPFPAVGFVETRGDGFHYVPASYQFG